MERFKFLSRKKAEEEGVTVLGSRKAVPSRRGADADRAVVQG